MTPWTSAPSRRGQLQSGGLHEGQLMACHAMSSGQQRRAVGPRLPAAFSSSECAVYSEGGLEQALRLSASVSRLSEVCPFCVVRRSLSNPHAARQRLVRQLAVQSSVLCLVSPRPSRWTSSEVGAGSDTSASGEPEPGRLRSLCRVRVRGEVAPAMRPWEGGGGQGWEAGRSADRASGAPQRGVSACDVP